MNRFNVYMEDDNTSLVLIVDAALSNVKMIEDEELVEQAKVDSTCG